MTNNPALYDAVLAGIAASNGAWIRNNDFSSYEPEYNAALAIASQVDASIPPIVPGATLSQRHLVEGITKSVMAGRSPRDTDPSTYATLAEAIAALFTEFSQGLQDSSTGGGGGGSTTNLTYVRYVDVATTVPEANQTGNIEAPFSSIGAASDDLFPNGGVLMLAPGDYTAQAGTVLSTQAGNSITLNAMGGIEYQAFEGGINSVRELAILPSMTTHGSVSFVNCLLAGAVSADGFVRGSQCIVATQVLGKQYCNFFQSHIGDTGVAPPHVTSEFDPITFNCCLFADFATGPFAHHTLANTIYVLNSMFADAGPQFSFGAPGGSVIFDGYSYSVFKAKGGSITNGNAVLYNATAL